MAPRERGPRNGGDAGMVIVETAIAIPVLLAVAAALLWTVGLGITTLALGDECGRIAREVARGGDATVLLAQVQRDHPSSLFSVVDEDDGQVRVIGTQRVTAPGLLGGLGVTLTRTVVAMREWPSA